MGEKVYSGSCTEPSFIPPFNSDLEVGEHSELSKFANKNTLFCVVKYQADGEEPQKDLSQ